MRKEAILLNSTLECRKEKTIFLDNRNIIDVVR